MVEPLEVSQHPVLGVLVVSVVSVVSVVLALHDPFWLSSPVVEVGLGWLLQHAFFSEAGLCWQDQKMVQLVPKSKGPELPVGSAVLLRLHLHFGEPISWTVASGVASGVASEVACRPLYLRRNLQAFCYGEEDKEKRELAGG